VHRDDVGRIDLDEFGRRAPGLVLGARAHQVEAADHRVDLVDPRQRLGLPDGVEHAPVAAAGDHHQAQVLDHVAGGQFVLAVVGRLAVALARRQLGRVAADPGAHGRGDGGALERLQRDHAGGEGLVGDDGRLGRDAHPQAGPGQLAAIQRPHHRRRRSDHRHPLAEGLLAADIERQMAILGRPPREQAGEAAIVVQVAMAQHRRVELVGVEAQQGEVVGQGLGRVAEVHQHAPGLVADPRRAQDRQPELGLQRLAGHPGAPVAGLAAHLEARQGQVGQEGAEGRIVDQDLQRQLIDDREP
jgi:hypothetical protein